MTEPPTLRALYRDHDLLVIDKPSGLPSQATRAGEPGAYELLRAQEPYLGLHHRLDTPASGLLLFTLSRRANRSITEAFRAHAIRRVYLARVLGDPGPAGEWQAPIEGEAARTAWTRLETDGGTALLELRLHTGRKHQIRLHASGAGHPVLGDRRHGGAAGSLCSRLALHAWRLELRHPVSGAPLALTAPVPPALRELMGDR